MKDMVVTALIIMLIIGLWLAIHIFAIIAGAGLAAIFLYHVIKEWKEALD